MRSLSEKGLESKRNDVSLVASLRETAFLRFIPLSQAGGATGAGQHAGRRHLVAAGGTVEPGLAVFALRFGKSLLLLAFGTLSIHFPVSDVVGKQQPATGALSGVVFTDFGAARLEGTHEDSFAGAAPILPLF
jgi:hypothetical protein